MNGPSFMMVLTGTGNYAYRRKDGVYVVPIGCLKDLKLLKRQGVGKGCRIRDESDTMKKIETLT